MAEWQRELTPYGLTSGWPVGIMCRHSMASLKGFKMFLDTKVSILGNWAADKNVQALIAQLGPMPVGGWPITELLEYFVGFDVMINNHPTAGLRFWVDAPGKRLNVR